MAKQSKSTSTNGGKGKAEEKGKPARETERTPTAKSSLHPAAPAAVRKPAKSAKPAKESAGKVGREKRGGGGSSGGDPLSQLPDPVVGQQTASTDTPDFAEASSAKVGRRSGASKYFSKFSPKCVDEAAKPNAVSCENCDNEDRTDSSACETCDDFSNFVPMPPLEEAPASDEETVSTKPRRKKSAKDSDWGRPWSFKGSPTCDHCEHTEESQDGEHCSTCVRGSGYWPRKGEAAPSAGPSEATPAPPSPEEVKQADARRSWARVLRCRVNGLLRNRPSSKELDELAFQLGAFVTMTTADVLRSKQTLLAAESAIVAFESGKRVPDEGQTVGGLEAMLAEETTSPAAPPESEDAADEARDTCPAPSIEELNPTSIRGKAEVLRDRIWELPYPHREELNALESELCAILGNPNPGASEGERVEAISKRVAELEMEQHTDPSVTRERLRRVMYLCGEKRRAGIYDEVQVMDILRRADALLALNNAALRGEFDASIELERLIDTMRPLVVTFNGNPVAQKEPEPMSEQDTKYVRTESHERELPVPLSREEVEERAARASALLERRDQKENAIKEDTKRMKAELARMDLDLRLLSTEIRNRAAVRKVQCVTVFDWEAGTVTEKRVDTGAVLDSRTMTDSERQMELVKSKRASGEGR